MLEELKNEKKIVGVKQSMKAVKEARVKTVIIAKDADEKVTKNLKELCADNSIRVVYVDSMKQLGKACNIEVGASAVAVLE